MWRETREREEEERVCVCVCVWCVCVCVRERERERGERVCVCVCGVCGVCVWCVRRQNIDPRGHRKWRLSGFSSSVLVIIKCKTFRNLSDWNVSSYLG